MTTVAFEPGVVDDMPDDVYHNDPVPEGSLSTSGAKLLLPPSTPALFLHRQQHPAVKREYDVGHVAHRRMLGVGAEHVVIQRTDRKTKVVDDAPNLLTDSAKAHETQIRAAGKVPILAKDLAAVEAMATALAAHPLAARIFQPDRGVAERSLFWRDPETSVMRRARLDWLLHDRDRHGRVQVVDYKTCDHADNDACAKAVAKHCYHMQADAYCAAADATMGGGAVFFFVFQEKAAPYLVNVITLDAEALAVGARLNRTAIRTYAECREADRWPGYAEDNYNVVSLPRWAPDGWED